MDGAWIYSAESLESDEFLLLLSDAISRGKMLEGSPLEQGIRRASEGEKLSVETGRRYRKNATFRSSSFFSFSKKFALLLNLHYLRYEDEEEEEESKKDSWGEERKRGGRVGIFLAENTMDVSRGM